MQKNKFDSSFLWFKISTGRIHLLIYLIPFVGFAVFLNQFIHKYYAHLTLTLQMYLMYAGLAFICSLITTPLVIKFSRKYRVVCKPEYPKNNLMEVPLLGGVAVFIPFLIVLMLFLPWNIQTTSIVFGAFILLVVGVIDDIWSLSSTVRLIVQLFASLMVISSGLVVSFLPKTPWGTLLAVLITLVWIIGIINATNFIDGVDGLATGFTVIACLFFFLITLHLEQSAVCILTAAIIGSCGGFLLFNFKPAKIYLGDSGSTLLGFFMACTAIYGGWSTKGFFVAAGIPLIILGILIYDMIYITISRILNGHVKSVKEWLDYRGRDHFHHRLINLGFKESDAVLFIYTLTVILGFSALVIENAKMNYPIVIIMFQAILIFLIITALMLQGRKHY